MGERVVTETAEEEEGAAREALGEAVVQPGSVKEKGVNYLLSIHYTLLC